MSAAINIELQVTDENLCSIVVTAIESGISYWARSMEYAHGCATSEPDEWYAEFRHAWWVPCGNALAFRLDDEDRWVRLDREGLLRGLRMWIMRHKATGAVQPDGTIETGWIDAGDADCIVQYAVFGELVYG